MTKDFPRLRFVKSWSVYTPGQVIHPQPLYGRTFVDALVNRGICEIVDERKAAAVATPERATRSRSRKRGHTWV